MAKLIQALGAPDGDSPAERARPKSDGTSQRSRRLPALDASQIELDERTVEDQLAFVQEVSQKLQYFEELAGEVRENGTWSAVASHSSISNAEIVSYLAAPERYQGALGSWLGRPHFGLLLTFLQLMRHAREQLNGVPGRHLDYFYRDVLGLLKRGPEPDQVRVLFGLSNKAKHAWLPAGTELQGSRDSSGRPRIYRTERDLTVTRAEVAELRSVFVEREVVGFKDVIRKGGTLSETFNEMLGLALGDPEPGDAVPPWQRVGNNASEPVDLGLLLALAPVFEFSRSTLGLEHHELRRYVRLLDRRFGVDAAAEWRVINQLLGAPNPPDPSDFEANFKRLYPLLDFKNDEYPQFDSIEQLYAQRADPILRDYIETHLNHTGFARFERLMTIKLRIDGEMAELKSLVSRVKGRPTTVAGRLTQELGANWPTDWPNVGTLSSVAIRGYHELLRRLERHFSMPVEGLEALVAFAQRASGLPKSRVEWSAVMTALAEARREKGHRARRDKLEEVRGNALGAAGCEKVANFVLGTTGLSWAACLPGLAQHLDATRLALLASFHDQLGLPAEPRLLTWDDALSLFELAQRDIDGYIEPVAERRTWRNLYAFEDAKQAIVSPEPGLIFKTFGRRPLATDPADAKGAALGWAVQAPILKLSQGLRTITLTLGFSADSFPQPSTNPNAEARLAKFRAALKQGTRTLIDALKEALICEISTAKGWLEVEMKSANLANGTAGNDYWSLNARQRPAGSADRPALKLSLEILASMAPVEALPGELDAWPTLRLRLRPIALAANSARFETLLPAFEPLQLQAATVAVAVQGLTELVLQHEDRLLDPKKPFEPFGSRATAGARFYIHHPELSRGQPESVTFKVKWMGLPKSLTTNYTNYPGPLKSEAFKVDIAHSNELGRQSLGLTSLFSADVNGTTPDSAELTATNFKALSEAPQSPAAERVRVNDVRALPRQLFWELQKPDFGWATYPALAAEKARAFAAELAKNPSGADPTKFQVDPPYAPKIQELSVSYQRSVEVELAQTSERTRPTARLLHVHPFGVSAILATAPSFFPPYPEAGELYIGLSDLEPGQRLTLLVQLAEGSSDPEAPLSRVSWSYLDEYGWQPLAADAKFVDSTRNLINSGIVEVTLPGATTDGRLPGTLRWLRVSTLNSTASVCDCVAVETQAITARFHDRGNAPDHYQNPLPPLSIDRLLVPQLEIALVEQPYTSFGGRPEEASSGFETRVSERLRHKNRALSPWDYEHLVLDAFPQIYRAKCLPASLSEPGRVELVVIPDVRATLPRNVFAPKAPAQLLGVVAEFLRERAPSAASINVRNARYVGLAVRVDVRFKPDIDEGYAKERLNEELVHFLSPWAYDEGADLVIGGRVYGNSILDFIDRRPYVDYVANLKLFLEDAENPTLVTPVPEGYFASVSADDEVLVSAKQHAIETVSASSYQQSSFVGVNYARVEFDFIVG